MMGDRQKIPTHLVRFRPDEIEAEAKEGENLLNVAVTYGVHIDAACGGAGACGKCQVQVEGKVESVKSEFLPETGQKNRVLACRTIVKGPCTVVVPESTRVSGMLPGWGSAKHGVRHRQTGLDVESRLLDCGLKPLMEKIHVQVPPADQQPGITDRFRMFGALDKRLDNLDRSMDISLLNKMPKVLREQNGSVTVTLLRRQLQVPHLSQSLPTVNDIEAGDTSGEFYALAFDIGTTSVWAEWLDLNTGKALAAAADYNDQIRFGADVINRIIACKRGGGLESVQGAVVETMNRLIEQMAEKSGLSPSRISYVTAAGNTAMTHIMLGIDPEYIRMAPFVPAARFMPPVSARTIGLNLPPTALVFTLPLVSAWVGGDIVSGVLVSGINREEKMTLFLDMGTNAEVVLGNKEFLVSASCSAGPAFEGGGIYHGVRAMAGAVEDFHLNAPDATPMVLTIGQKKARGICGSGLINTIAGLSMAGVLLPNGKFVDDGSISRLHRKENEQEYVLVEAENSATGYDITLTSADVENLLRAKSAIYAGISTLLAEMDMKTTDIEQVLIAGSFGQSLNIDRAIMIGLLPDLPPERFRFIGNSSLMGARLVAQCVDGMGESDQVAQRMTYIDLGASPRFMDEYMAGMFLPHTDMNLFPSVARMQADQKGGRT
ncbi:MAG: DUF4445 domain-containing protein [Myxococcales bacterium]|nr:MAG: DUF4445 domain-containing protein [Myxococcales bacterium]